MVIVLLSYKTPRSRNVVKGSRNTREKKEEKRGHDSGLLKRQETDTSRIATGKDEYLLRPPIAHWVIKEARDGYVTHSNRQGREFTPTTNSAVGD